jgi:uncharacterized protein YdhG (YjbR/CyaY superfamily)
MRRRRVNRSGLRRWAPNTGTIDACEDSESRSTSFTTKCDMTAERKPTTIDDYLKRVPEDRRRALEDLRAKIQSIVPDAEECISYRIPAFRVNGVVVAGFCATAKGCSYFPFSGSTLKFLARDISRYDQTKGSLHFSSDEPLPTAIVRKLIKARIAETKE